MRLLWVKKLPTAAQLQTGKDNYAYDLEKKVWLPGRTTPVRAADMRMLRPRAYFRGPSH
jgi:hypothetical protein